jgi:hypothetical protein
MDLESPPVSILDHETTGDSIMSVAVKVAPTARYGLVAQLGAYAGLSVKMVRRMLDLGKAYRVEVGVAC